MATMYVNAANVGSVDGLTPSTGYTKLSTLLAGYSVQDGDIIEVLDTATIDESAAVVYLPANKTFTIRAYQGPSHKPLFKLKTSSLTHFVIPAGTGVVTVQDLQFWVDSNTLSEYAGPYPQGAMLTTRSRMSILGCCFYQTNQTISYSMTGILAQGFVGLLSIQNCIFNHIGGIRGAVVFGNTLTAEVDNCVVYNPSSSLDNRGFCCEGTGSAVVKNTIVYGTTYAFFNYGSGVLSDDYNCLFDTPAYTGSNLSAHSFRANPLFVNAAGNDFHIQATSPCVDKGTSGAGFPTIDYDGVMRPLRAGYDVGAYEYAFYLNHFTSPTVTDGTTVTSTVSLTNTVGYIQGLGADTYFDSTSKIGRVDAFYAHEDGGQSKVITHKLPNFVGTTSWSYVARDGTWTKTMVKVYDKNGATTVIPRITIGISEDLTHSSGTMYLNS